MTTQPPGDDNNNGLWQSLWREAVMATTLGWNLAIPIFGGVLIGYLLDQWLGTDYIFTIGLLVMGIVVGYYNLGRFIQRLSRQDREQAPEEHEDNEKERPT